MIRHWRPGIITRLVVLVAVVAMVASACSSDDDDGDASGVSQADLDAVTAELADAEAEITSLEGQLSSAQVTTQIVQPGELAPSQFDTIVPGDGWANEESVRGGLWLEATFDSSGPDAWDIEAHPRVYFTSESYSNDNYPDDAERFIGWHVIDAYSKVVIASANYRYDPSTTITRGPHGVGVSPDGKWGYVGWSETPEGGDEQSYVGIINTRTMLLDKLLKTDAYFEGGRRSQRLHHIQAWTHDASGEEYVVLQWGFGANGGPHHILMPNDDNRVFRSITFDDVRPMGHPFTTPSPDGQYLYISMGANWLRESHAFNAGMAKFDIETGEHEVIEETGHHPIGVGHTMDGRWTYVIGGTSSNIFRIDNETNEVVAHTSAGVAGPYGICMNWDETLGFVVGKGEGTHNRGHSVGVIDLVGRFRATRALGPQPIYLGGSASSIEHCSLHPDPEVNEIWISNMNGFETIVVSLDTFKPTDHIATPLGGDTHGMAFVWYDGGWDNGVLMGDMGGPKEQGFQDMVNELGTAARAAAEG